LAQTLEETIVSLLLASLGCESEGALIRARRPAGIG
jgi:hypothetical protein